MPRRGKNKSKNKRIKGFIRQAKRSEQFKAQIKNQESSEITKKIPDKKEINQNDVKTDTNFEEVEDAPEYELNPPYRHDFPKDQRQAPRSRNGTLGAILCNDYNGSLVTRKDRLEMNFNRSFKNAFDFYKLTAPGPNIPRKKIPKIGKVTKK